MGDFYPLNITSLVTQPAFSRKRASLPFKYKVHHEANETSKINFLEFNPVNASQLAVTTGTKVSFFNLENKEEVATYAAMKNIANCTSYRRDGCLLAIGDDASMVHIVDSTSRRRLRRFKGHTGAVRCCQFLYDKTHLLSGGDDKTVKIWDLPEERCVRTVSAHMDSIRSLSEPATMEGTQLWASGSYDGTVKLWDGRIAADKEVCTLCHEAPIETVAFFPSGFLLASAGGNQVKLWDISEGGKLVKTLSVHTKTVTSLAFSADGSMLLSGALDRTVKWSSLESSEILKSYLFDSEVAAVCLSPKQKTLAIGLMNGKWSTRQRKDSAVKEEENDISLPFEEQFARSAATQRSYTTPSLYFNGTSSLIEVDRVSADSFRSKVAPLDRLLRSFQYKEALDLSLTLSSSHVVHLVEELIQRGALYIALGGRDEITVLPTLQFIYRNICGDPQYTSVVLETLQTLLDENGWIYYTNEKDILEMLKRISQKMGFELLQQNLLQEIQGVLDMILAL